MLSRIRAALKKSIFLALIEKTPKILLSIAFLVCVFRAAPGDLPKIVDILVKSELFCLTGWIVALVVIVVAIVAVGLYIKLKPKNTGL